MSNMRSVSWKSEQIGSFLSESRVELTHDDPSKRLSVRLHLGGVEKRSERDNDQVGNTKYFRRKAGQFIYGKQNLHRGSLGIIPEHLDGFSSSQDLPTFDISNTISPEWFLYYLSQEHYYKALERIATGTGSKRIQPADLYKEELLVPPLQEQQIIAEILTSVDEVIENTQSQINKLEDLKKATMNELLTKGIGHTEFKETEIGRIPKSWQVCLVKDLFAVGRGRVISAKDLGLNPGIYPVFSSQSKDEGVFGYINTYDFEGEHITWTTDGAYAGTVFYRSGRFNCTNVCGVLKAHNRATTHTRFLSYYLSSVATKYVSYVGNPKLMNNIFSEIPVVLPPYDEQVKIDTLLLGLEQNIKPKVEKFAKVSFLKKSLMQDLLTGKVRGTVN
jgi:type I restriction enzyme S subunit